MLIFFLILIFHITLTQTVIIEENKPIIFGVTTNYFKHDNLDEYVYGLNFNLLLKGNLLFNIGYNMSKEILSDENNYNRSNEAQKYMIRYIINRGRMFFLISYKETKGLGVNDLDKLSSFSTTISRGIFGERTKSYYYPYLEIEYPHNVSYHSNLNPLNDASFHKFLYLGCVIKSNDFYIEPFYKILLDYNNQFYSGIRLGKMF